MDAPILSDAEPAVIDGLVKFIAQRQGAVVVIQCMECGEHATVSVLRAARRWQQAHAATCPGDDGGD